MTATIMKILSAVMSVIIAVSNFLGLGDVFITDPKPTYAVEVVDQYSYNIFESEDDEYRVFGSYIEWKLFRETCQMNDCSFEIDKDFFKNNNLVLLNVMLPDTRHTVELGYVYEAGSKLILEYVRAAHPFFGSEAITYKSVFVPTSKTISEVSLKKHEDVSLPFYNTESVEDAFTIDEADFNYNGENEIPNDWFNVFSDYESWSAYLDSGVFEFDGYADEVDEEYFESKNLVVGIVGLGSPMSRLRINLPHENGDTLELECYSVSQPGYYPDIEYYEAVFVEVSKEIDSVNESVEDFSVPFVLDGSLPTI